MPSNLETLTQINLDDLVNSFGWQDRSIPARLLRSLFFKPAQTFAKIMLDFDTAIGSHDLVEASHLTERHFAQDVRVFGLDRIPDSAFLALSNHPGISDTLSLFCALNRPDLKIIALDRPFLNTLPNLSKQLFYVKEDSASRMSLVRQVTAHLRAGGAALTFPAGQIEPDPDIHEGAVNSLNSWTDSAGVFIRMAPETAILPILVRGVIWDKTAKHFLLAIKKTKEEKEKLATALQLLRHIVFKKTEVHVRIQIGRPIYAKNLAINNSAELHQAVLAEMKYLIENPPEGAGVSVIHAC
jgi:hypothetical protein